VFKDIGLKSKIELEFMQVEVGDTNTQSYLSLIETVTEVMLSIANSKKLVLYINSNMMAKPSLLLKLDKRWRALFKT